MDLPKTDSPDLIPPNTMSKDAYKLKIVSVTSKLTHWDLLIKHEQNNFLQYPEEEHHFQEYSEEYNREDCTKTKTLPFTNIDATYENVEVKNEIIEELDSANNFAHIEEDIKVKNEIIEEVDSANDFVHIKEGIEVKNEITEEFDSFNHFVPVQGDIEVKNEMIEEVDSANDFVHIKEGIEVKNEITEELNSFNHFVPVQGDIEVKNEFIEEVDSANDFVHIKEDIEVKDEIIEGLDSSFNNFVHVEEEATHDLENDKDRDINDSLHITTEPKVNGEVNLSVQEFNESETIETSFSNVDGTMNGSKNVDKVLNHFENVDKVLKHFEKVDWISKDKEKLDTGTNNVTLVEEIPTFKCNFCYKSFMGNDAYYQHIKKHSTKTVCPNEVRQFDAVLKVGDAVSDKCTLVKVKKIRVKRLNAIDKSNEDKVTKSKTIRILSDSSKTSDSSENNGNIAQNNSDSSGNDKTVYININKANLGGDTSTVKDKNTAVEEESQDLLIEIPGKTKIIKLDEKKARTKRHIKVVYKKCDEDCLDDEHCTQSKECRTKRRRKSDTDAYYACEICDYRGKHKNHLDAHMLTHVRVKSFKCQECGYKCVQRSHLDQHMRTHSRDKPYSCNRCDYNCVQKSQLDQHMRTHTKARPFRCNICGYSCTQRCHLDQHMRRHTGIKPYSCIFCEYKCVQRAHLDQHIMNVHTNVHIFRCLQCKYRCLQLDQLTKHMKVHNVEPA